MLDNYSKVAVIASLFLLILGCSKMNTEISPEEHNSGQLPRRKVTITIDLNQQQQFFDQLRKFAEKHNFTISIDTRPPGINGFYIDMYREDVMIAGTNPFVPAEYQLGFYDADRQNPRPQQEFDFLVTELENFMNEVPDVIFIEVE